MMREGWWDGMGCDARKQKCFDDAKTGCRERKKILLGFYRYTANMTCTVTIGLSYAAMIWGFAQNSKSRISFSSSSFPYERTRVEQRK